METHIFVGIDLGDKNSVALIGLNRENGERFGFMNHRAGRARLFAELKKRAAAAGGTRISMAYEASSCGFILSDEAEHEGIRCWVLAPTKMEKSIEQRKHKNDARDAEDILEKLRAHLLAGNRLPTVWIPDMQTRDDRELIRTRLELGEKQTQLKSQVQMLLKRRGLEKPTGLGSGWTIAYRAWLKVLSESDQHGCGLQRALSSLLRQLAAVEAEFDRLEKQVEALAREQRHKPIVEELRKERGVGVLTALVYRTEIGYAGRFRRGRQLGKYSGLTPTSHESGQQTDRKGHISRQGSRRLRKMLCQASWAHIRYDRQAQQLYRRLVERNPKKKKIAIVAVMRRLAVRLWHRMRKVEIEQADNSIQL